MKKSFRLSLLSLIVSFAVVQAATAPSLELNLDSTPIESKAGHPVVSYADVLDQATPSVVAVYTARIVSVVERAQPRTLRELYEQYYNSRPDPNAPMREEKQPVGVGSGVIVTDDGYVVTNNHVIRDRRGEIADEIRVRLSDDREFLAELIGADEKTDVAVLKIESDTALPAITIAESQQLRVGDVVFAIGNPLGVGLTATQGIVSATQRNSLGILGRGAYEDFIQTDAAINPGNSGGALIDAWGRLVGINTAIVSGTGANIGIGFAIPAKLVLNVMTNLVESGEVPRGLLGLIPEDLTSDLADAFGLDSTHGALVNQVQAGSPADLGGIHHGDVITQINSVKIDSAAQLRLVVSQTLPGTEVQVHLIRDGEAKVLPVVLGSLSGQVYGKDGRLISPSESALLEGIQMAPVSEELRKEYEIPEDVQGVLITEVAFDSPYAETLTKGMLILEVNGQAVDTVNSVEAQIRQGVNRLYAWFNGNRGFVSLRLK